MINRRLPFLFALVVSLSACERSAVDRPRAEQSQSADVSLDIPEETRREVFFAVETAMLEAENDPEWQRLEKLIRSHSGTVDNRVGQWLEEQQAIDDKYIDPVLKRFDVSESEWVTISIEAVKKRWPEESGRKTTFNTPLPMD